jgi:choice-of-anchor A domain-containing protein
MPRYSAENRKMTGLRLAKTGAFALFALLSAHSAARAQEISSLSQLLGTNSGGYNAYVLGDIGSSTAAYTSDSQGAIAAGGNVYLTSFAGDTNGLNGGLALVTGGNVTISNGSINGGVDAGGNVSITSAAVNGTVQAQGTVTVTNASRPTTVTGSSAATPINFTALAADSKSEAISIASLAQQAQASGTAGTVSGTNNLTLTGTSAGVNYFNLTAAQMAQLSSGSLTIDNTVAGATDIISVTGASVTVGAPGNFGFSYQGTATASNTLFDFSQATSLTIANAFDASVLAPTATVNFTNGNLTGILVAGNLASTQFQDGEFHAGSFTGTLPSASPAPAPQFGSSPLVGLLLVAALALGLYRRRPAATAAA